MKTSFLKFFLLFLLLSLFFKFANAQTFEEQTAISITGVDESSVAWGDYNNDGFLDILLTGWASGRVSKIYKNNGNGTFSEQASISLTGVYESSVAWGDYNNDGFLDILLTGNTASGAVSKIYKNNGNGTFTEHTPLSLTGVYYSSVAWGDYNNDGYPDILLTGRTVSGAVSKIYKNNGDGTFSEQTGISLKGVYYSSVAWGDYNNDGFLDILLTGRSNSGSVSKIYKNNGNGTFIEQTAISLTGVEFSSVAWGDYNNDGFLDILLTGYNNGNYISKVYKNNGNGTFTEQASISLKGVEYSSSTWGDYNNDGYTDILLTGYDGINSISKIYKNNGNGSFSEQASIVLTGVRSSSVVWGDYDKDGDLDILLTGNDGTKGISKIYKNLLNNANSAPSVPQGITATVAGNKADIKWQKSTDDKTGKNGITYNLRMGTTAGGMDILSPAADKTNGLLKIPAMGNMQLDTAYTLLNLKPSKTYYYSVQAIDHSFVASAFSGEGTFTTTAFPLINTNSATNINVNTATLNGIVNVNGSSTSVWFEYKLTNDEGPWQSIAATPNTATGTGNIAVSANLTGLSGSATYIYRIKVTNSSGSVYSEVGYLYTTDQYTEAFNLIGVNYSSVAWGDYDNDGDLDILLTGQNATTKYTRIYRNDGNDLFTEMTGIILPNVSKGSVAWGDYNNDNYLDILLTGGDGTNKIAKIYKNNGNSTFSELTSVALTTADGSSAAWGDYNNDGFVDIILAQAYSTKIYKNNGNETFSEQTGISLTGLGYGSVAWGDYNNDGYLDILLTGTTGYTYVSKIYKNNGNGTFTDQSGLTLTAVSDGKASWGDYNQDGYLDILLAGETASSSPVTKIYKNNGDGTFTEQTSISMKGFYNCSIAWGDYNNDGFLDVFITGTTATGYSTKIYSYNGNYNFNEIYGTNLINLDKSSIGLVDYDNDGDMDVLLSGNNGSYLSKIYKNNNNIKNTPPAIPANIRSLVGGHNISLLWDKSTDNNTPQNSISYNVRVGKTTGGTEVLSPMANTNSGLRKIAAMGNVQLNNSLSLKGLSKGTYYWSVQALDNCYAGSAFSNEGAFTITDAPTIETTTVGNINATMGSVVIGGKVNANSISATVTFEYGTKSGDYTNWKSITATPGSVTGYTDTDVSAAISGLDFNTVYYFRVKAINTEGTSYGGEKSFIITVPPIANISMATNKTITSATLNGTINPINLATTVTFEYGLVSGVYTNWTSVPALPGIVNGSEAVAISANIAGLTENSRYYYRVKAVNTSGTTYSSEQNFKTLCNINLSVTTPTGTNVRCPGSNDDNYLTTSSNSTSFLWSIVPSSAGIVSGTTSSARVSWNNTFTGSAQIYVQGINGTCEGAMSTPLNVTVNPNPAAPAISGASESCQYAQATYSVTPQTGYSYNWSVTGGSIISGQSTNQVSIASTASGNLNLSLTWKIISTGCSSVSSKTVAIKPGPEKPTIKMKKGGFVLISKPKEQFSYQWYKNDVAITDGKQQFLVIQKGETGNFKVETGSENGCKINSDVLKLPAKKGSFEEGGDEINVYPNPNNGIINIEFISELTGEIQINIIDLAGANHFKTIKYKDSLYFYEQISLNDLKHGLYIIELVMDTGIRYQKKIIIH